MQYKSKCGRNVGYVEECGEGREFISSAQCIESERRSVCDLAGHGVVDMYKADLPEFIMTIAATPVWYCPSRPADTTSRLRDRILRCAKWLRAAIPTIWEGTQRRRQWRASTSDRDSFRCYFALRRSFASVSTLPGGRCNTRRLYASGCRSKRARVAETGG
jgi:hypothetical protein